MKELFERIVLRKKRITYLLLIIRNMKMDLLLQRTCFNHKDNKEAKLINQEILDWLKELDL